MDTFTAQIIGVFLAETAKNVAKGSANLVYNNFNSIFHSEIIALDLNDSIDAEEITRRLEAKPEVLETVRLKLTAHPEFAEEMSKIVNNSRHISANTYIEKIELNDISLDSLKSIFNINDEQANKEIQKRVDEFFDCFLHKLNEINSDLVNSFQEPSMQYAWRLAKKGYAISGSKDLRDLLVDILIEKAKQTERNLLSIVLETCIEIAPKLTTQQLNALSILFLIKYVNKDEIISSESLKEFLENQIKPFTENLTKEESCYMHLQSTGCGGGIGGENFIIFENAKIEENFKNHDKDILLKHGIFIEDLFDVWDNSDMNKFRLTDVGIALAQANVKMKTGVYHNLSDWIK